MLRAIDKVSLTVVALPHSTRSYGAASYLLGQLHNRTPDTGLRFPFSGRRSLSAGVIIPIGLISFAFGALIYRTSLNVFVECPSDRPLGEAIVVASAISVLAIFTASVLYHLPLSFQKLMAVTKGIYRRLLIAGGVVAAGLLIAYVFSYTLYMVAYQGSPELPYAERALSAGIGLIPATAYVFRRVKAHLR